MSTLARNTLFLTAASIGQKAIAFIYFTVIARAIGVENTGAYFLALAMITSIGVLDDLGMTSVIIREVAKKPEETKRWLRNIIGIKCLTMPLTVLIAWFVPTLMGFGIEASLLVRLAVFIMLADTLSLTFYGVLRGMQQLKFESLGIFFGQAITTVLGAAFLLTGNGTLPLLVTALIAGSVWNAGFSAFQVARRLGWSAFVPSFDLGSKPLKMGFAFFLSAVFVKVYSYVDSFTLQAVIGDGAVGLYSVAYKLTYAFQFLPLAFVGALYPTLAATCHSPKELKRIFLDAVWYMALLASPIVFGIFALAPEIIGFFYGSAFAGSVMPLSVLIFVLLFIFLDFPIGSLLNATGHQAQKTAIMGITMIVNVTANVLLIPRLGIVGASLAAVMSFAFMFTAGWWYAGRIVSLTFSDLARKVGAIMSAGAAMALVVMALKSFVPWLLTIPLGAGVFSLVAFATKAFTMDHVRSFRSMLTRKSYASTAPDA
ncbi:MAG: flippase [Candidatus Uhrbacteria bacterium]|nr:flippase [Candidatus Uhrbacteria bacterium]